MTKLVWGFGKMPDGVLLLAIDDFFGAFSVAMGLLPSTYLLTDVVVDDAPRRLRLCFWNMQLVDVRRGNSSLELGLSD